MRTFIALEFSDDVKTEFSRLEGELKKADADVKWVKPENIHLTLKFLGEVEEAKVEQIKRVLDDIASKEKPFEISLFKLGAFPSLNQPRVIWIGIDKNCSEVEKIAALVDKELTNLGFAKEERAFSAHCTLGRLRSGKNKTRVKEIASSLEVKPKTCLLTCITLFKSTLTPTGPIYTALHKAGFKP